MPAAIENDDTDAGRLLACSKHIKVMSSMERTDSGHIRHRLLRDVDELHAYVQRFPKMPHRRGGDVGEYSPFPPATFKSGVNASLSDAGTHLLDGFGASGSSLCTQPPRQFVDGGEQSFLWIDLKKPTRAEWKEVVSWFPLHSITLEKLTHLGNNTIEDNDRLEYFPAQGYTFLSLTGPPPLHSEDYPAVTLFILWENALLTISDASYPGEENVALSAVAAANRADGGWGHTSAGHNNSSTGDVPGIATIFSALVSSLMLQTQSSVTGLLIDVDQLDELVLQIQPSEMDQNDMLTRIREARHRVARYHTCLLLKERVLKQLLLPTLRSSTVCRDRGCVERYQRSLTLVRSSVERLRKARDTVNLSCMNLVSGVSARLVQHCHWMDYLNHVQGQISLVVMPVAVIPGLWAGNEQVPFQTSTSKKPFWILTSITLLALCVGLIHPVRKYFLYKPPGALVNIS